VRLLYEIRHQYQVAQEPVLGSHVMDITELRATTLGSLPAYIYSFQWPEKERAVILIEWESSTYRIIYDPGSPLNEQIIATIEFVV